MSADDAAPPPVAARTSIALLVVAVCLIAANMRATITGLGPLLEQIADDRGTTATALGALASVPLVAWALVSPLAHGLSVRFGMSRAVLWSLVALALGTVWRSLPGSAVNLWLGTAIIGASLAIANVLMPAVVKRDFAGRVPMVLAAFTALLGGMGAISSGVVVPISRIDSAEGALGWRVALLATGVLLPLAITAWAWAMRRSAPDRRAHRPIGTHRPARTGVWTDRVAWLVAGYMGCQAASFYMLLTWLAPISTSLGRSEIVAGLDVMVFQILGVIGAMLLPAVLRGRVRRWVPAVVPAIAMSAAAGLLLAPGGVLAWAAVAGLAAGASLAMALTLMAERAPDPPTASALSGMAQSIGYVIAAFGPIAFGGLHALTSGWTAPILLLAGVLAAQVAIGGAVGGERLVLARR